MPSPRKQIRAEDLAVIKHFRLLSQLTNNRRIAASLATIATVGGLTAGYASCGKKKSSKQPTQRELPEAPPLVDPANGKSVVIDTAPLGLDGKWAFESFECTSGKITPWAKLENTLVGPDGLVTPTMRGMQAGRETTISSGRVRRSHVWTIDGTSASRLTKIEYFSLKDLSSGATEATAWLSTTKSYMLNRTVEGRLILVHGKMETPVFKNDWILQPLSTLLENLGKGTESGTSPVSQIVQKITSFFSMQREQPWFQSLSAAFNDVTQATEAVDYTFDNDHLAFSNAAVTVLGLEVDVPLVDKTTCGLSGQATRHYNRIK